MIGSLMDIKIIYKKNYIEKEQFVELGDSKIFVISDERYHPWFLANSICQILGYKCPQKKIQQHVSKNNKKYFKDLVQYVENIPKNKKFLQLASSFINKKGVMQLITSCQLPKIDHICENIGIDTLYRYKRKEIEILDELDIFLKEINIKYIAQKRVKKYKIDVYLPKYNLVIEIDEHNHVDRDKKYEHLREGTIKKWLNCTFIRCNPDKKNFNIHNLTGQITKYMLNFINDK